MRCKRQMMHRCDLALAWRWEASRPRRWKQNRPGDLVLQDWHRSQGDSGVHSATAWALRSWELSPPKIEEENRRRPGFDWQVTKSGLTLVRIPAGEVVGADNEGGPGGGNRKQIQVEHDFWLSDREITVEQFLAFLDDEEVEKPTEPDKIRQYNQGNPLQPVVYVSWYDAVMFCNWLSRQEGRDPCYRKEGKEQITDYDSKTTEYDAWTLVPGANGYRLPTEAEWEYACRAGTTTAYSFGDAEDLLDRYAVFIKNSSSRAESVASKLCNAWGLFDMHGNVCEWCQDWYEEGSFRVFRGGSWNDPAAFCRSAYRGRSQPYDRSNNLGFRVAAVPFASQASQVNDAQSGGR